MLGQDYIGVFGELGPGAVLPTTVDYEATQRAIAASQTGEGGTGGGAGQGQPGELVAPGILRRNRPGDFGCGLDGVWGGGGAVQGCGRGPDRHPDHGPVSARDSLRPGGRGAVLGAPAKRKGVPMMRGHKRGCRCVGCSPATRAKGMWALKRRTRNPLTNPAWFRDLLIDTATRYDMHNFEREGYDPRALSRYLKAVQRIVERVQAGDALRTAIASQETGLGSRLTEHFLLAVGEASRRQLRARRGSPSSRNPLTRAEGAEVAHRARHSLREARELAGYPSELVYAGRAAAYRDVVQDFTARRNPRRASVRSGGYFWSASEPGGTYTLQWFSGDWRRGGVPAYGTKGFTSFLGPFATESAAKTWGKRALVQNPRRAPGRYSPAARAYLAGEIPALEAEGYPPRRAMAVSLAMARRAGLTVPARNPHPFLPGVPDLVRFGVQRVQVYGARELGLTWAMAGRKDREDVDAWLVRIKHPLAYQAGTAEQRFGSIVTELAARGNPLTRTETVKALRDVRYLEQLARTAAPSGRRAYRVGHVDGALDVIRKYGVRPGGGSYTIKSRVHLTPRDLNPLTREETATVLQRARIDSRAARQRGPGQPGGYYYAGRSDRALEIASVYGQTRRLPRKFFAGAPNPRGLPRVVAMLPASQIGSPLPAPRCPRRGLPAHVQAGSQSVRVGQTGPYSFAGDTRLEPAMRFVRLLSRVWLVVVLLSLGGVALAWGADATAPATAPATSTLAITNWVQLLIPIVVPILLAALKFAFSALPSWLIPILAPVLGGLGDAAIAFASGTPSKSRAWGGARIGGCGGAGAGGPGQKGGEHFRTGRVRIWRHALVSGLAAGGDLRRGAQGLRPAGGPLPRGAA